MPRKLLLAAPDLVLALVSFLVVAGTIRAFVPWPEALGLQAKMEYFEEHKDEFDALYIGSSRAIRGIDNAWIDRELAARGIEMHSFNLAVGGMRTFEQDYLLHRVLEMEPARLKWIFFEGGPIGMGLREDHVFRSPPNLWSSRGVHWHDWRETSLVLDALWRLPLPLLDKLDRTSTHVQLFGWKLSNYGKGEALVDDLRRSGRRAEMWEETKRELAEGQGHQGLEAASGKERAEELDELLADPAAFDERVREIAAENAIVVDLDTLALDVHREQYAAAERHGVELIYFIPPGYEGSPERLRLHEAGIIPTLFHFNDPERYPELFRLDHRYDKGHLNRRGVDVLSAAFAEAIAEHLEASAATERGGAAGN